MLEYGDTVVNGRGTMGCVVKTDDHMAQVKFNNGRYGWFSREGDKRLTVIG